MKPISKLFFILYNLILIFIFKSFVNLQTEISVTLTPIYSYRDDTEPLLTLIKQIENYIIYILLKKYIFMII